MTAPEVGFVFCQLSTAQTKPKMKHFALYRKAVKELKSRESMLRINKINIQDTEVLVLRDRNFELLEDGIDKVQCLDGEIKMINIRNRDKKKVESMLDELFSSYNLFNTDVRM